MKKGSKDNSETPIRVIGTVRVSTAEQEESGAGLAAQETAIRAYCTYRGYDLVRIATDTGSGKTMAGRAGLAGALADIEAGKADGLIASKLDRLARSTKDVLDLMERAAKKGFALIILDLDIDTTTSNGKFLATVMAAMAELERNLIGDRTKAALAEKRAAGVTLGRPRALDPAVRAKIIKKHKAGMSLASIARQLTEDQVPTATGGKWYPSTIRAVVTG